MHQHITPMNQLPTIDPAIPNGASQSAFLASSATCAAVSAPSSAYTACKNPSSTTNPSELHPEKFSKSRNTKCAGLCTGALARRTAARTSVPPRVHQDANAARCPIGFEPAVLMRPDKMQNPLEMLSVPELPEARSQKVGNGDLPSDGGNLKSGQRIPCYFKRTRHIQCCREQTRRAREHHRPGLYRDTPSVPPPGTGSQMWTNVDVSRVKPQPFRLRSHATDPVVEPSGSRIDGADLGHGECDEEHEERAYVPAPPEAEWSTVHSKYIGREKERQENAPAVEQPSTERRGHAREDPNCRE
jgi:hypothetical protein